MLGGDFRWFFFFHDLDEEDVFMKYRKAAVYHCSGDTAAAASAGEKFAFRDNPFCSAELVYLKLRIAHRKFVFIKTF